MVSALCSYPALIGESVTSVTERYEECAEGSNFETLDKASGTAAAIKERALSTISLVH